MIGQGGWLFARMEQNPEEMLALAQEEGYELSGEQLEGVSSGGLICDKCSSIGGYSVSLADESRHL